MSTGLTGPISVPLDVLRTMLSLSPIFQSHVGASDASQALSSIYLFECNPGEDLSGSRPLAVLGILDWSSESVAGGAQNYLRHAGGLWLYLADNHPLDTSVEESGVSFCNFAGGVIHDLVELSALDEYLSITDVQLSAPPVLVPQEDREISPWWDCVFDLQWK